MVKSLSTTLLLREIAVLQPSTLALYVNHTLVKSRVKVHRLDSCRVTDLRIKVEILNICNNNRRAQTNGVGEIPLNRKGMPRFWVKK